MLLTEIFHKLTGKLSAMGFSDAAKHIIQPAGDLVDIETLQNNWAVIEVAGFNSKICCRLGVELNTNFKLAIRLFRSAWINEIQKYKRIGAKLILVIEAAASWPMKMDEQRRRRVPQQFAREHAEDLDHKLVCLRTEGKYTEVTEMQRKMDKLWERAWFVPRESTIAIRTQLRCASHHMKVTRSASP